MSSPAAADISNTPASTGPSQWVLLARLLRLGWDYRWHALRVLLGQLFLVVLQMATLGATGLAVDVIRAAATPGTAPPRWPLGWQPPAGWSPFQQTAVISGVILVLALAYALTRYAATLSASHLVQTLVVNLRSTVYHKLQRLSFRFFDAHPSGAIINRVAGDVQAVRMFIDAVVIQFLTVFLSLALYLAYMLSIHVPLTIACLATTPLLAVGAAWFSRRVRPSYVRAGEWVDRLILTLSENIQGVHVVKGFALEDEQIERFRQGNERVRREKETIFWRTSVFQPLMGFLTQWNMLVLLAYGGYLVINGQLRLGEGLFVFANLLYQFANQVAQVTNIANSVQHSLTGAQRVFEILDAPEEIQSPPRPIRLSRCRGEVEFDGVSFAYAAESPVLDEIRLRVEPGRCVAIVGATGAGKTTLLSLIPRFYDATAGSVRIDGHDVRDIHLDDLRRNVGLVFQESFLFSNTVAANIAFGQPEASDELIERAARTAAVHDFVAGLPRGYETVIGEYGANLSGGQRQRLAIARALLLDPPILLLDDATAAIDPGTEEEILAAMDRAMAGRTTFVIAHRLSTLRRADRILVLEGGRIVQQGTHEQLLAMPGHYRQAALLQQAGELRALPPTAARGENR